jgi:hypothetical protein
MHGVDEGLALPHLLEEARGHAAADDVVEEVERVALGRDVGDPGEAQHQVHLLEGLGDHVDAGMERGGRDRPGRRRALPALEAGREEVADPLVLHVPGHRHRDAPGHVLLLEVAEDGAPVEGLHPVPYPQDGPPEGMPRPHPLREEIVDEVVGSVLDHLDLLEDHRLFLFDVLRGEERPHQDVAQQVHRQRHVLVEDAHVETGVLLRGEGVHVPAHRVDGAGNGLGGAGGGALEEEVLDEMGDAAPLLGLHARARVHPDAHRDGADMRHRLGDEADAVGKDALAVAFRHYAAPVGATLSCSFSASAG